MQDRTRALIFILAFLIGVLAVDPLEVWKVFEAVRAGTCLRKNKLIEVAKCILLHG